MTDMFYYGAVSIVQTEEELVVEYRFTIAMLPIAVLLCVQRNHNDKTYEQLLHEASSYARQHYTMLEERGN
jgi:hypothetical protein